MAVAVVTGAFCCSTVQESLDGGEILQVEEAARFLISHGETCCGAVPSWQGAGMDSETPWG